MDEMLRFRRNALMNDICKEGNAAWTACNGDKEKLVSLCMEQRFIPFFCTYCANGNGLTKEYILREYAEYINGRKTLYDCDGVHGYSYQLFVDFKGEILHMHVDVAHLMFCEGVVVTVEETRCPVLYVSNHSNIKLNCDGYNNVLLHVFDDSSVEITDLDEESRVIVYKYSNGASVERGKYCLGKVRIVNKELQI